MGSDVYLRWKDMKDEEKERQNPNNTMWSLDRGFLGYLRASVNMPKENTVLRMLFPEKFWDPKKRDNDEKDLEYDFVGNLHKLQSLSRLYLMSMIFGIDIPIKHEGVKQQLDMAEATTNLFKNIGLDLVHPKNGQQDLEVAVQWVRSLFAFFRMGAEKQEEGLKPKIIIKW